MCHCNCCYFPAFVVVPFSGGLFCTCQCSWEEDVVFFVDVPVKVALKLRSLHPDLAPEDAERRLPRELLEKIIDEVTKGFKGDVGVVPRQFLRKLVNILDVLADDDKQDAHAMLGFAPTELSAEESAVIAGRTLDVPVDDDDEGFGGASVPM